MSSGLQDGLYVLAEKCAANAALVADAGVVLDKDDSLAAKNWAAAALSATQAWLTATRQDSGRR